jgi:hypothetical protein
LQAQRLYLLTPCDAARAALNGFHARWQFQHDGAPLKIVHADPAHDFIAGAAAAETQAGLVVDLTD